MIIDSRIRPDGKNSISLFSDFIEYYMIYNIISIISLLQIKFTNKNHK